MENGGDREQYSSINSQKLVGLKALLGIAKRGRKVVRASSNVTFCKLVLFESSSSALRSYEEFSSAKMTEDGNEPSHKQEMAQWMTVFFVTFLMFLAGLGVTVGAHRLWTHETFKASCQLQILLMLAHTLAGVGPIYDSVLAHKLHHHYYGTDKDPYNHRKGFLYSHVLSNVMSARPDFEEIKKPIDMRMADSDNILFVQKSLYWVLFIIIGLLIPIIVPIECWGECPIVSLFVMGFFRLGVSSNMAWLVNSGLLIWGLTPGEKYPPRDNSIFFVRKSYWLPYHYMFPWDWKSGEFGTYDSGLYTLFIKICNELSLVTNLNTLSSENVRDGLCKLANKKSTLQSCIDELKAMAKHETEKANLQYHH
ncbi:hypothetical protein KM043_002831 [Ampulex compressa]|nr:hypothetical protein KM043_002831 [Ampulex compressa]